MINHNLHGQSGCADSYLFNCTNYLRLNCRQELVTGKALPSSEELQDWEEGHAGGANEGEHSTTTIKGVPYFWLTVLCNQVSTTQQWCGEQEKGHSRSTCPHRRVPDGHSLAMIDADSRACAGLACQETGNMQVCMPQTTKTHCLASSAIMCWPVRVWDL